MPEKKSKVIKKEIEKKPQSQLTKAIPLVNPRLRKQLIFSSRTLRGIRK